jgi:hypothetical protein
MIQHLTYYDTYNMQAGRRLFYCNKVIAIGATYYEYKPVYYGYQAKSGLYVAYHDEKIEIPARHIREHSYYVPFLNHKQGAVYRSSLPKWMLFTDISEDERKTKVLK